MINALEYRSFLIALREKMINNPRLKEKFSDRVVFLDDEEDPILDGISFQKPFIAIDDFASTPDPTGSGQMEESLKIRLWVITKRPPTRDVQQMMINREYGTVTLWELLANEMCSEADRNDFSGTSYSGEPIIEAYFIGTDRRKKMGKNREFIGKYLDIEYQRVLQVEVV